jgi:D-amino-acid dehydrogenase
MQSVSSQNTVIVGAGVIGAAIAYDLQRRGRKVTLVDRDDPGRGASFGNMASIAVSEFMPVARPSTLRQIPGWLLDRDGPICVSPRYMPRLIPWFMRFLAASRLRTVRRCEAAGAALCERALADMQSLMGDLGIAEKISETGCLTLYANAAEFRADAERIDMLERFGFRYDVLDGKAIRDLEPAIAPSITKAVLLPDNRTLADPYLLIERLVERFSAIGGQVVRGNVTGFDRSDRINGLRLDDGRSLPADDLVLCAGAYTSRLAKMLSEPIPLETERGYSTQIMAPGIALNHSIIWPAKAFMVSPTAGGIRVGGTVEMAGLDAAPDYRRARITVRRACEALPDLQVRDATEWMGHRPAFPDTIPLLSPSAKTGGVFYATGHGHLGVTYAATTAKLMGQMITGERPEIDLAPYHINRF